MSSWWNPTSRRSGRSLHDRLAQDRRRRDAEHRRAWKHAQHERQRAEWARLPAIEQRRRITKAALAGFVEAAGDPTTSLHRDDGVQLRPVDPNRTPPTAPGGNHCVGAPVDPQP
jgi:hypothetical protein